MAQLKSPEELHYTGLSLGDPMMGRGQDPTYAYLRYTSTRKRMELIVFTPQSRRSPRVARLLPLPLVAFLPGNRLPSPQPDKLPGSLTTPHARGSTNVESTL